MIVRLADCLVHFCPYSRPNPGKNPYGPAIITTGRPDNEPVAAARKQDETVDCMLATQGGLLNLGRSQRRVAHRECRLSQDRRRHQHCRPEPHPWHRHASFLAGLRSVHRQPASAIGAAYRSAFMNPRPNKHGRLLARGARPEASSIFHRVYPEEVAVAPHEVRNASRGAPERVRTSACRYIRRLHKPPNCPFPIMLQAWIQRGAFKTLHNGDEAPPILGRRMRVCLGKRLRCATQ